MAHTANFGQWIRDKQSPRESTIVRRSRASGNCLRKWRDAGIMSLAGAAMLLVFAVSGRGQNSAWVAQCTSSPIVTGNGGSPTLDNFDFATQTKRVGEDRLYDMSYQMVDDGANGSIIVFESRRRNVEEPPFPDNVFQIIPDSRHMYLRHINASGATLDEAQLDDGTETVSLPHIIKRADGGYIVTYRESGSSGDNIVANWYTLVGGHLIQGIGPVTMVTSDFSYGIGEYSICRDSENGVVIAAAVSIHAPWTQTDNICNITWQESPDSAIYAQWIGGDGTRLWSNSARLISDPTWTGHTKVVFNPIASIETRSNHLVDIAWGQEVDNRSSGGCYCSYIFVQRLDITLMYTYDQQYPNGGVYLPLTGDPFGMDHAAPQHNDPFYMTYCYSLATASPLDVFVWRHGTASDNDAGRVMVEAYTFGSPSPTQVWAAPYEVPNAGGNLIKDLSEPSGIVPYSTQRGNWQEDDPVIVYMRDDGTGWNDNDGICTHLASVRANHTANVFRLNIETGVKNYDQDIHTGIGSQRFVAQMAVSQNGLVSDKVFSIIPDWDQDFVCKIDPNGNVPTVLTVSHRCSPYKDVLTDAEASRGDCYEAISLGTDQINVVNFEYGLPQIEKEVFNEYTAHYGLGNGGQGYIYDADRVNYAVADDHATYAYMTKPYSGHFYGQNAKLLFQSYPTAGTFAAQLTTPALLEGSGLQHGVESTNVADTNAIVYEQWYDNGSSDIKLAYSLNAGQTWQYAVITDALTTGYNYVTPKVAIYNGSGTQYAIITYNRESVLFGTSYSGIYSAAVNLTSGAVSSVNNLIESVANYPVDMRNFDLVVDPISDMLYAVYGHGFSGGGPGNDQIECAQLMSNGAPYPYPYPTWVDTASRDKIMQVSACFDPDPANPGVYIVWRDHSPLGPSKVGLNHISNVGTRWRAGIQYHISLNDCYQPRVAAAPKWVMMTWSDEEQTFNPYSSPLVFACAWDNTGNVLPGWTIANGIQVSIAAGQYTGTYYEAFDPAIIVTDSDSVNGACLIAFSQDEDPAWSNFSVSSPRSIGTRSVAINGTLGAQGDLAFNAAPNPNTELTQSLFGYMERKPKLSIIGGHDPYTDIFLPWTNWVLCAFQTMPYHYAAKPYEALELANYYEGQPVYAQSNISAFVLSPNGYTREMGFNVANGPNAQELEALHWSADEGFWACYLNYDNSDNHASDIGAVNIRSGITQFVLDQNGADWTVPLPGGYNCHDPNPLGRYFHDTHSVPLNNTSLMSLPISAVLFIVQPPLGDMNPPDPTDFSSDLGASIPPIQYGGFAPNNITYRPRIFHDPCDPVVPFQELVTADPMGGPPYLTFFVINCNAQKATTRPTSEPTDLSMVVTPNPSTGEFELHLQGLDGAPCDIEVVNLLGQVVYHASHSESQNGPLAESLDLSSLPSGQYVIRLSSVGRMLNSMIVLQK